MKYKLCLLVFLSNAILAVPTEKISQDLTNLMAKIRQVNQDLINKQQQQHSIDQAINDSDDAIDQSEQLLAKLRQKRDLEQSQLDEIAGVLPQLTQATQQAQGKVKLAVAKIYQQINIVQNNQSSILTGNEALQNNKEEVYLLRLLQVEQKKYQELQAKLDQLNTVNINLEQQLDRLDDQLGITNQRKQQLEASKAVKMQQSKLLAQQIANEQQQLANLKEKQEVLNQFMAKIAMAKARQEQQARKQRHPYSTDLVMEQTYEDNSPFLAKELAPPIEAKVAVPFGAMRGGVRNNGILFAANDSVSVYAIAKGKVMYTGNLPGFGPMIVIDNGNNYISIYGGVLPQVVKGQQVGKGSIIANAGTNANQPMGGVYFELRHLGRPVNPSQLIN